MNNINLDYDSIKLKNEPNAILICALLSKAVYENKDTLSQNVLKSFKKEYQESLIFQS